MSSGVASDAATMAERREDATLETFLQEVSLVAAVRGYRCIVVTTDKGLCGGMNTNVLRSVTNKLRDRVYEVSGTAPVKVAIMGAELTVSGTSG